MASDDVHKSTARLLLSHAQAEYASLADTWQSIEQKAQGTVAIVGIFLTTAAAAYSKIDQVGLPARYVLFFAVLCLVAAALIAITTLFVRSFTAPEGLEEVVPWARSVYAADGDGSDQKAIRDFVGHRIHGWTQANKALHKENGRKAQYLRWSQILLFAGIVLLMVVYGLVILVA
jgi:hypothetical protein